METILVLTDFSYAAFSASRYAIKLANQLHSARVILHHSLSEITDNPPPFASEVEDRWIQTTERLNDLKTSLEPFKGSSIQIETSLSNSSLQAVITSMAKSRKIGLVVMGSTGNNKLTRLFIGGSTLSVSETCTLPLLIVPPDTDYEVIERTVFACDMGNSGEIPVRAIRNFNKVLHSKLSVLYFDDTAEKVDQSLIHNQRALHNLLTSVDPDFSFIHGEDMIGDIFNFSNVNNIQLIIVIHKKHQFLKSIFHPGAINQLAYYSHFPVLILKPLKCKNRTLDSCFKRNINHEWHNMNSLPEISFATESSPQSIPLTPLPV